MTSPTLTTSINPNDRIYKEFNLKTDDDTSEQATQTRQGRMYSRKYSQQPGGVRVDDMIYGLSMAHLSCTDDSEGRLQGSGPNTVKALEEIVGADHVHKPLNTLLKKQFDLTLDCWINESGLFKGRPVDTQGYIASNESTIVLSFRFTTTITDWMTNISMSSSEWEPDRDELIGHAGYCSCLDGWFTKFCTTHGKPRVHTGFYNNFIYTIPYIRQFILNKLLQTNATPKKVYICGCSLGAAIATLAFCFVLQEMEPLLANPEAVHHQLICVTAGSPRVCDKLMRDTVMKSIQKLRPLDRAVVCRMVYNHDLVPHIPFAMNGFVHLDKLVYITHDGKVIVNPKLERNSSFAEVRDVASHFWKSMQEIKQKKKQEEAQKKAAKDDGLTKTPFEIECETTPEPIKDHMPYWYLTFLKRLKAKVDAGDL